LRVANRERSAEPARRLGCAVFGCAGTRDRGRAVACVAQVVRVAAREQDDIAAAYVLDVRVSVDPEDEFALFDDVQAADIGKTNRESPQRSVRNDPFSAQADAPEQLREQVVRLTTCVEAERGFLER
jgi:sorbitol-specific phosphotransferase system component IIBC